MVFPIMILFAVVGFLVESYKDGKLSSASRNRARNLGQDTYLDANNREHLVSDGRSVYRTHIDGVGYVLLDANTHEIIKNYTQGQEGKRKKEREREEERKKKIDKIRKELSNSDG